MQFHLINLDAFEVTLALRLVVLIGIFSCSGRGNILTAAQI